MKDTKELNIDEFVELRAWAFRLLKEIALKQMKIAENLSSSNKSRDWDIYLKKVNLKLSAYSNAKSTVDSLIKNIDSQGDIAKTLKKIEAALKKEE